MYYAPLQWGWGQRLRLLKADPYTRLFRRSVHYSQILRSPRVLSHWGDFGQPEQTVLWALLHIRGNDRMYLPGDTGEPVERYISANRP